MAKRGEDCTTMAEVREGVDALDRELVALLVKRQAYMSAAGRIKNDRDAVYDAERIEDVVSKVLVEARKQGLSEPSPIGRRWPEGSDEGSRPLF